MCGMRNTNACHLVEENSSPYGRGILGMLQGCTMSARYYPMDMLLCEVVTGPEEGY